LLDNESKIATYSGDHTMGDRGTSRDNSSSRHPGPNELFKRLAARGIDELGYLHIKKILTLDLPQMAIPFERQFAPHTPAQTLRLVERWRRLLKTDFILSKPLVDQIVSALDMAESLAWYALVETAFPSLGDWEMSRTLLVEDPAEGPSRTQITAIHRKTGERRSAVMPGSLDGRTWLRNLRKAFADLKLLHLVLEQPRFRRAASSRRPQSWPVFTQFAIPRLYEYMLPHYVVRGHIFDKDGLGRRNALYPRELLDDMLSLLRLEQPGIFDAMTIPQLKAVLQRYLAAARKVLKS
jgi:hypothetical protein